MQQATAASAIIQNGLIPSSGDLEFAERFLFGDHCPDPLRAHAIIKTVLQAGRRRYPTLWERALLYAQGTEYQTLEKLSQAPDATLHQHPFTVGSSAIHRHSGKQVVVHALMYDRICYRNGSVDGSVRADCWDEYLAVPPTQQSVETRSQ